MISGSRSWNLARLALVGGALLAVQCAATPRGATDANFAAARSRVPAGAAVYERECARCHGAQGAGRTSAPEIMGPGALPEYRRIDSMSMDTTAASGQMQPQSTQDPARTMFRSSRGKFVTAQNLFDYVSTHMPQPASAAGTLKTEEYWAVVNFILTAHGTELPAEGVTPANAKSVNIRK